MANVRIQQWETRSDGTVKMTVAIFPDGVDVPESLSDLTGQLAHYEIQLPEPEVTAALALPTANERNQAMMALFLSDVRIQNVIASERAVKLLTVAYKPGFTFPL